MNAPLGICPPSNTGGNSSSRRWRGKSIAELGWSPQRDRAMRDLRAYERAKAHGRWEADRMRGLSGKFLAYRLAKGKLRPFHCAPALRVELVAEVGERAVQLLELIAGAEMGYRARVVVVTRDALGALLGVSDKTAGTAYAKLEAAGMLERRPHFRRAGVGHAQLACSFRIRKRGWVALGVEIRWCRQGGRSFHPSEHHPSGTENEVAAVAAVRSPEAPEGAGPAYGAPQALKRLEGDLHRQVRTVVQQTTRTLLEGVRERLAHSEQRATERAQRAQLSGVLCNPGADGKCNCGPCMERRMAARGYS